VLRTVDAAVYSQEAAARAEEAARLHREFMSMLRRVLDGHMDSSTFEDSCRALLGTNSYVLFTLDKLIQKFIKHMAVSDRWTAHGMPKWTSGLWRRLL